MDYYQNNWDRYWHSIKDEPQGAPWDVIAKNAGERDFQLFKDHLLPQLPIADLGCGNGAQTLFLSKHYPQVIGLDVAPQAIEMAQKKFPAPNITYQVFNALDNEKAQTLHQGFGDINIYMRGTLQQIKVEDRERFVTSLKILLGATGALFLIEILPGAKNYFAELARKKGGLPGSLRKVLVQRITGLVGVSEEDLLQLFPSHSFHILKLGASHIAPNIPDVRVPACYAIVTLRG